LLLWLAARLCATEQLLARAAAFAANLLAERKPALHSAGRLADRAIRQSLLGLLMYEEAHRHHEVQAGASPAPRTSGAASCCMHTASQNARIAKGLDTANRREIGIDLGF
jgi:hypothetical protein